METIKPRIPPVTGRRSKPVSGRQLKGDQAGHKGDQSWDPAGHKEAIKAGNKSVKILEVGFGQPEVKMTKVVEVQFLTSVY